MRPFKGARCGKRSGTDLHEEVFETERSEGVGEDIAGDSVRQAVAEGVRGEGVPKEDVQGEDASYDYHALHNDSSAGDSDEDYDPIHGIYTIGVAESQDKAALYGQMMHYYAEQAGTIPRPQQRRSKHSGGLGWWRFGELEAARRSPGEGAAGPRAGGDRRGVHSAGEGGQPLLPKGQVVRRIRGAGGAGVRALQPRAALRQRNVLHRREAPRTVHDPHHRTALHGHLQGPRHVRPRHQPQNPQLLPRCGLPRGSSEAAAAAAADARHRRHRPHGPGAPGGHEPAAGAGRAGAQVGGGVLPRKRVHHHHGLGRDGARAEQDTDARGAPGPAPDAAAAGAGLLQHEHHGGAADERRTRRGALLLLHAAGQPAQPAHGAAGGLHPPHVQQGRARRRHVPRQRRRRAVPGRNRAGRAEADEPAAQQGEPRRPAGERGADGVLVERDEAVVAQQLRQDVEGAHTTDQRGDEAAGGDQAEAAQGARQNYAESGAEAHAAGEGVAVEGRGLGAAEEAPDVLERAAPLRRPVALGEGTHEHARCAALGGGAGACSGRCSGVGGGAGGGGGNGVAKVERAEVAGVVLVAARARRFGLFGRLVGVEDAKVGEELVVVLVGLLGGRSAGLVVAEEGAEGVVVRLRGGVEVQQVGLVGGVRGGLGAVGVALRGGGPLTVGLAQGYHGANGRQQVHAGVRAHGAHHQVRVHAVVEHQHPVHHLLVVLVIRYLPAVLSQDVDAGDDALLALTQALQRGGVLGAGGHAAEALHSGKDGLELRRGQRQRDAVAQGEGAADGDGGDGGDVDLGAVGGVDLGKPDAALAEVAVTVEEHGVEALVQQEDVVPQLEHVEHLGLDDVDAHVGGDAGVDVRGPDEQLGELLLHAARQRRRQLGHAQQAAEPPHARLGHQGQKVPAEGLHAALQQLQREDHLLRLVGDLHAPRGELDEEEAAVAAAAHVGQRLLEQKVVDEVELAHALGRRLPVAVALQRQLHGGVSPDEHLLHHRHQLPVGGDGVVGVADALRDAQERVGLARQALGAAQGGAGQRLEAHRLRAVAAAAARAPVGVPAVGAVSEALERGAFVPGAFEAVAVGAVAFGAVALVGGWAPVRLLRHCGGVHEL
ncbi:membrane-associated zinc metalloprotease, putative [Babesia caballi]|uniref:Membrane-associated zinc metalloprotease, putative n=1 Tax=Babesia caballi TaxID=5871 RepID=A0AAV4LTN2_BABCB|nr:membrane-associated zinc metalloprotease, putative [Babesia caballi]